jgi:hypothetical protein
MPTDSIKKLENVLRHIKLVQDATQLLGKRLIESGEEEFGRALIARGLMHDVSKLRGIEWKFLHSSEPATTDDDKKNLSLAIEQHHASNEHHIEFWGDPEFMPRLSVAEMICDLYARAQEFGSDVKEYIFTDFFRHHKIGPNTKTAKRMKFFLDVLLNKPFKKVKVCDKQDDSREHKESK